MCALMACIPNGQASPYWGVSSDQAVVNLAGGGPPFCLGDGLVFEPFYAAVATVMASFGVPQVIESMKGTGIC